MGYHTSKNQFKKTFLEYHSQYITMANMSLEKFMKRENIGASIGISSYYHNGKLYFDKSYFDISFGHKLILLINRIQKIYILI